MGVRTKANISDFSQGVGTTSTPILSAFFPRNFLLIKNNGPGACAVNLTGGTATANTKGNVQLASGNKLIFQKSVPQNAITAISASTSFLTVQADDSVPVLSFLFPVSPPANIDLNFSTGQYWISPNTFTSPANFLTVSRASVGIANDSGSNWNSFANNIARVTDLGLLVEESRTNGIRNNTAQGAVVGTPGTLPTNWAFGTVSGLTSSVVGVGTENNINFIDLRFNGVSAGTLISLLSEGNAQVAALYGQTWSSSIFVKLVGGTLTNVTGMTINISERDGGGASLAGSTSAVTLTSAALGSQRNSVTRTFVTSTVAFAAQRFDILISNGAAIDLTVRYGWPQLENNAILASTVASATVQAGGSGYTPGTQTVTLTGGTGTAATLSVTISAGGNLTAVISVLTAGSYTVFPTSPAPFTITGAAGDGLGRLNLVPTDNSSLGFPSSPIVTTNAAATRAADVVSITDSPVIGPSASQMAIGTPQTPAGNTTNQNLLSLSDGTAANREALARLNATGNAVSLASVGALNTGTSWTVSVVGKSAMAFQSADYAISFNGGTVATSAAAGVPSGMNLVEIGSRASQGFWNGFITRTAIWPYTRLPNATLQSIST